MRRNRSIQPAAVIPVLTYPDVRKAAAWLCDALGFAERLRIGQGHRVQLTFGDSALTVAEVHGDRRAPRTGEVTHSVTLRVGDAAAACERARERGATVVMAPRDTEFGERQCDLADPWGHRWTLSETRADVAPEEWGGETVAIDQAGAR